MIPEDICTIKNRVFKLIPKTPWAEKLVAEHGDYWRSYEYAAGILSFRSANKTCVVRFKKAPSKYYHYYLTVKIENDERFELEIVK